MSSTSLNNPNELAPTLEPLAAAAEPADVRESFDRLAAMGFRFVQLSATQPGLRPRELDQSARRDLLAVLRRRELMVAGLDAWIPPQHFLDSSHSDRAVSAVQQAIELAGDLGRVPVSVALPTASKPSDDADPLGAVVRVLSVHADRFGVLVADHSVPLVRRDEGVIGVGIDPAALLAAGDDPAAKAAAGPVYSARLCDLLKSGRRGPIGERQEGRLDLLAYKIALSVSGYARPVILDARQWADPWRGINLSRSTWEQL